MTPNNLNPSQREQLHVLIERRLSKLNDDVLLNLERLTRNPQRLKEFVPKTEAVQRQPNVVRQSSSRSIHDEYASTDNGRRQVLKNMLGLTMLGAVGGGAYFAGQQIPQQTIDQYKMLESVVQTATEQHDIKVTELTQEAQQILDAMEDIQTTAVYYHDTFLEIRNALDRWWIETTVAENDYDEMRLVEGGVRFIAELLGMLASLPQAAINLLGNAVQIELGNLDDLKNALLAVSKMLLHLDSAFHEADTLHIKASPWFFDEDQADIKNNLLEKLVNEFSYQVQEFGTQVQELEWEWQQDFLQPVNKTRQQIKRT